jgi:trimeric autotransporter adhesin
VHGDKLANPSKSQQFFNRRGEVAMRNNRLSVSAFVVLACVLFAVAAGGQTISTIAGGGPPNGLSATMVPIGLPWAVVQDSSGNTYISDNLSNRIFKVDTSGNLSVVAGNSVNNYSGDGGSAVAASLSNPEGMALDTTNGALYIADSGNNVIRVVNTGTATISVAGVSVSAGDIATVAGTGSVCTVSTATCGDAGLAKSAQMNAPGGVALDSSGNIFIADTSDNRIREVSLSGIITTVAGTGTAGYTGSGTATAAKLAAPGGVYVDSSGNLYIADSGNNVIEEVTGTTLSTVVGTTAVCTPATGTCGDGGLATGAQLTSPAGVYVVSGNIYIADTGDYRIREVTGGNISTIAGNGVQCTPSSAPCSDGGPAGSAELNSPTGVFENSGNVFIADQGDSVVREIATSQISRIAGIYFNHAWYGDTGPATSAELQRPFGLASDSASDLFIADAGNSVIREIDAKTGDISTVAGDGTPCSSNPSATCGDQGSPTQASLWAPTGVFVDNSGNIYIADSKDDAIRVVNTSTTSTLTFFATTANKLIVQPGTIATVAGEFVACPAAPCGDAGSATLATLNTPSGVFLDKTGNIYIADTGDNVIRVVNTQSSSITIAGVSIPAGDIAAVAGNYTACATTTATCGDGAGASKAQLNHPSAVFVDASGTIYIVDGGTPAGGDNRIRAVNPQASGSITVAGVSINAGDIATIAGTGTAGYSGDSHAATLAELNNPGGIFVDASGNIFISDGGNSVIRSVSTAGNIQTVVGSINSGFGFSGDGGLAVDAKLAQPYGLAGNTSGDLLIADSVAWRVRSVTDLVATSPTATPSPTSLTFSSQATGTTSSPKTVTISNGGIGQALTVTSVAISGTDAGDYKQTNTCTSVAAGSNCTVMVTFAPTATGTRTATLTVTDNAGGVAGTTQTIALTGTATAGTASFTLPTIGTLTPASVSPGTPASATITVTSVNGFNSAVALTCTVSSTASLTPLPGCSFTAASVTPTANGTATSTLNVTTTGPSAALTRPAILHRSNAFYAIWLFLPAMLLGGTGMATPNRRRKMLTCLLLALAIAGSVFLVACGGSSSSSGGGGSTGTPAGSYTVTVTATSGSTTQNETLPLTVQ